MFSVPVTAPMVFCHATNCDAPGHFEKLHRPDADDWRLALLHALYPADHLPIEGRRAEEYTSAVRRSHLFIRGFVTERELKEFLEEDRDGPVTSAWLWFNEHVAGVVGLNDDEWLALENGLGKRSPADRLLGKTAALTPNLQRFRGQLQ